MQELHVKIFEPSLSRRSKKSKSPDAEARSLMLKAIMPKLSGERGKQLANAFVDGDKETIRKVLTDITNELSA